MKPYAIKKIFCLVMVVALMAWVLPVSICRAAENHQESHTAEMELEQTQSKGSEEIASGKRGGQGPPKKLMDHPLGVIVAAPILAVLVPIHAGLILICAASGKDVSRLIPK